MRKALRDKLLANCLAFAVAVSGGGLYFMANEMSSSAAEDNPPFTKVLGAEDIDLRAKWNDKSNIGEEHVVQLSKRSITVKDNGSMRPELSSQQLADTEMGLGINLGNTMEAVYDVRYKNEASVSDFEKIWSQPITTREWVDCVHSYGINTLRIPVAWSNGDKDDGTYTIRPELLDRVEEIANYALDNGMYVIINDHWDNQWWGQFGACLLDENGEKYADTETRAAAWARYERYWTQICERFKNYSDHLIFEGANEELGTRLNDAICISGPAKGYSKPNNTNFKTVTGNLKTNELYETTNKINQKFVDIVRASGGNNASRHLMIPGYNTDIGATSDARFVMPSDPKNSVSKLFLSVHYYAPTDFALDDATGTYTKKDQEYTKKFFKGLQRFNDMGHGVVIGECGFCNPSGVSGSVTQWFYDTYSEAAKYHAVPVLWDTGAFFDRTEAKLHYKDIAVFYNTVNGTNGSTDMDRVTGGAPSHGGVDVTIPDYIDKDLWATPGMHAYAFYQTPTWDYRNAYVPLRKLSSGKHSFEYIQAGGFEPSALKSKVTDVQITKNGKYTVSLEGINLSGANSFNMLGVSTDIDRSLYPGVTATDAYVKIDGKYASDDNYDLVVKSDDQYYSFMLINVYPEEKAEEYPLGKLNKDEKLKLPSSSIEITFRLKGLDQALDDIAYGNYVNPETGEKIPATATPPTPTPSGGGKPGQSPKPGPSGTGNPPAGDLPAPGKLLKKGASFASGNYKYKVSKVADSGKGTVTLTGLTKKGKSAKKLSLASSVKASDGASYAVSAIGKKAFYGAKAASITLNKKIKVITSGAFGKCKKLSSLTCKAKLSKAAKNSFKGCKKKIKVKGAAKKANKKLLKKTSYKKFK
ncbi:MAG: cellulase family glycosylhydrolase [Lachnospiraceae bacterium]|nr:cellulase family glycosylhydrolase [Lachnospiraceae bacterium]